MRQLPKEIGQRVKAARKRFELTQAELAEQSALDEVTIRAIEAGRRGLSLDSLARVARVLGLRPGELLDPDAVDAVGVGRQAAVIVDSLNPAWQRAALRILREIQQAAKTKPNRAP